MLHAAILLENVRLREIETQLEAFNICHLNLKHWPSCGTKFVVLGWTFGVLGIDFRRGLGIFLFTTVSRTSLEPTQSPIQWVPWALSLRVKRLGCEADHSPPSSAEVKNAWRYTSIHTIRLHGVVLS